MNPDQLPPQAIPELPPQLLAILQALIASGNPSGGQPAGPEFSLYNNVSGARPPGAVQPFPQLPPKSIAMGVRG